MKKLDVPVHHQPCAGIANEPFGQLLRIPPSVIHGIDRRKVLKTASIFESKKSDRLSWCQWNPPVGGFFLPVYQAEKLDGVTSFHVPLLQPTKKKLFLTGYSKTL